MLIVPSSRAVLLPFDAATDDQIRSVIPTSKRIVWQGKRWTAVKHGHDESKVLKNLGFEVPSPMMQYYDWPGKFKPYKHQLVTAEFMATNPRCFNGSDLGCVDSETEYLTPTGWNKISEYRCGVVAQFDPATNQMSFVEPSSYIKLPCEWMYKVKTNYGVDQMLSPEHRVLAYHRLEPHKYETLTATELYERLHTLDMFSNIKNRDVWGVHGKITRRSLGIKDTFLPPGRDGIPITDAALRVQIAVVADGYFRSRTNSVILRIKKDRKKERIRRLLTEAGIPWREKSKDYPTAVGFTLFQFDAPLREKEFGSWAWEATPAQLAIFADEFVHWDGSLRKGKPSCSFSSYSKASADFIQYACASSGRSSYLRVTRRERRGAVEIDYTVSVRHNAAVRGLKGSHTDGTPTDPMRVVPSTDGFKYCFTVPTSYLVLRRNGCIFTTGNSGKSASAIWAADWLMKQGIVKRVLIICPLSCVHSVWSEELFRLVPEKESVVLHGGSKQERVKLLSCSAPYHIINVDGIKTMEKWLEKENYDLIIVDESSQFRTPTTQRYKALCKIVKSNTRLWLMSGTPCPNSPTDVWSTARLLNPANVPTYFTSFKRQMMEQITQYKWVPKPDAFDVAFKCLQPGIRFTKEECLDLPDLIYVDRECELTPEQKKAYDKLHKEAVWANDSGQVTAANAAVLMMKLMQVAGGVVKYGKEADEKIELPCGPRLSLIKELIEENSQKVIVFSPFKAQQELIKKYLEKEGIKCHKVNGDTPEKERRDIFRDIQNNKHGAKVLIAVPQAMSHGITLTAANMIIWAGPTFSGETYNQANARIHRAGQVNKCTVVHLYSSKVEREAYKILKNKLKTQAMVLELFKREVVGV